METIRERAREFGALTLYARIWRQNKRLECGVSSVCFFEELLLYDGCVGFPYMDHEPCFAQMHFFMTIDH